MHILIIEDNTSIAGIYPSDEGIATLQKIPEISGVIVSAEGNIYQEGSRAEIFG